MKKYKVIIIAILITIFIEVFVCNYGFFRSLLIGNTNIKPSYEVENGLIKIENINVRVTSINFEYDKPLTDKVTYLISYITEGTSAPIDINPKIMLIGDRHYINIDTHSKCQSIEITRLTESQAKISSITLNHPNMNINLCRMLFIFLAIVFIMKLRKPEFFEKQYDKNSTRTPKIFLINLAMFCSLIVIYTICQFNSETFIIKPEDIDTGDAVVMQAEAIMHGKIELLEEPSKELTSMADPYDHIKRDRDGVEYLYDVTYYDGHYYSYFGIAPVLTMILPFRAITGVYLPTYIFNMVYVIIAIFALYFLYKQLVDKYIEKTSLSSFYLGFFAILFGSNLLTLLRGMKYEIVISSGMAFLLISLNLALSIYTNSKLKFLKLVLLGITTALVVLSKPTFIVYYLLILLFVVFSTKDLKVKEKIRDLSFAIVPLRSYSYFSNGA